MSPAAGWGEQFHIQVLCSLKRGQCGRGEIVDAQDTSHVVDNDTVRIGRPVRPLPRPVAFSAGPFYTSMNIQNVDWAFDTSAVIESEDLWWERERSASHWYPLMPSALENNELHFHFWRTGSYPVSATFEIHRNTIGVHVPWTENINYTAIGPTSATSLHWFAVGDGKFAWDTQHNILKYYLEGVNDGGMNYDFVAADPNNAGGHVAGTQLAKSHRKAWYLGGNVWTGGTNNEWLLDGCTLYDTARGAAGAFHWQSRDSPGQGLLEVLDSVFIADTFRMYFMYRPRGRSASDSTSIWVPLQKLTWWYNAKLINDSASVLKHWWSVSGSVSKGSDTSTTKEFPEWNGIEPSGDCPPLPAP
jgi:hypothetical protein